MSAVFERTVDAMRGLSDSEMESVYWFITDNILTSREALLRRGKAAFEALRRQAQENGLQDMTEDEIEEEIRLARAERAR